MSIFKDHTEEILDNNSKPDWVVPVADFDKGEEWTKSFDEKFPCIQSDCDGKGSIPHQVAEDEWEAQQCEFHAKYLFPFKALLLSHKEQWKERASKHLQRVKIKDGADSLVLENHNNALRIAQEIINKI